MTGSKAGGEDLRRTQAQRTAETRGSLVGAAVECLVELGYARTTTREVARRAGVSRGAQTHHFHSKEELVVAAIEHLFDVQALRFTEAFAELPAERRTFDEAVGLLWDIVRGPSYPAVLEVITAGRTDPELGVVVHAVAARLQATVARLLRELFPELADERVAHTLIDVAFTLVQGAAVASYAGFGDPERTIRVTRALLTVFTPQTTALLEGALDAIDS